MLNKTVISIYIEVYKGPRHFYYSNPHFHTKTCLGGRNGYGAKLCNIFSKKFTVETACKDSKKTFKQVSGRWNHFSSLVIMLTCEGEVSISSEYFPQTWYDNMGRTGEASIKPFEGEEYTCITFQPDLSKFKMSILDKDTVALMTRRAYDIAGSSKGVRVFLNGKRLPVSF